MAVTLGAILFLTLRPTSIPDTSVARIGHGCLICGSDGTADAILNALLFLPLGIALTAAGLRPRLVLVAVVVLSTAIEIAQLGIPGRYSNLGDVVFNTAGGFTGSVLGAHATGISGWLKRHRFRVAAAMLALPLGVAGLSAWLLLPAPQRATYYGQWTPDLGPSLGVYQGSVVSARIADRPALSRRLPDSEAARRSLLSGDTVSVVAVVGPPPGRLASLFSIYDQNQEEVMLLGIDGSDLVLRIRRNAVGWRLHQPDLRWREALRGVRPGDTVRVLLWRDGAWSFCLRARSGADCATTGPWQGWALIYFPENPSVGITALASVTWIGAGLGMLLLGITLWWPAATRTARSNARAQGRRDR